MEEKTPETTWANVDLTQDAMMAMLDDQEDTRAKERVQKAVRRLQHQGILDENGRRIRTTTPSDMQDGSQTEFGG